MKNTSLDRLTIIIKWLFCLSLFGIALWSIQVAPDWTGFARQQTPIQGLFLLALISGLFEKEIWTRLSQLTRLPSLLLRLLIPLILTVLIFIVTPPDLPGSIIVIIGFIIFNLLLLAVNLVLKDRTRTGLGNLAVSLFSLLFTLLVVELLAPTLTQAIASAQRQAAINRATSAATAPLDANSIPAESSTPVPVSLSPQTEIIQAGGGPAWGLQTGWGTNTDTILRYWMDGVYDNEIEYNSLGFRGPEISYEKPDDVYRIMLVGDSFMEAREVAYDDTIYAQLGNLLKDTQTSDGKKIEVFGVGATGWGTLQAYLYYHNEGYRFAPDLIIHFFIINDVVDNNPQQFYKDRNIDFAITDNSVQLLTDGSAPQEQTANPGERWLNALPAPVAQTNIAALLRRIIAPPRESVTLGGSLGNAHPQNYIFVREPDIEGYPEGWRRTQRAYEIWANEARQNGSEMMVVAVDISVERITEISTYFPDEQQNWVWDVDLPFTRLSEILSPLNVKLISTRQRYADYAASVNQRPFEVLFYTQDGHWNPTGHKVTAELLADTLLEKSIVIDR